MSDELQQDASASKASRIKRLIKNLGLMLKVSLYIAPSLFIFWLAGPYLVSALPESVAGYVYWGIAFYLFAGSNFALARSDTKSVRDDAFNIDTLIVLMVATWAWPWLHKSKPHHH